MREHIALLRKTDGGNYNRLSEVVQINHPLKAFDFSRISLEQMYTNFTFCCFIVSVFQF